MSKWGHLGMVMCLLLSTPAWASIGKVSLLKGEATASRNNQSIELMNGTNIEEHDFIATRANSQIQLTFEDKTVITLGSESTLDIQDYLNDANNPKAKFKFNQGTFKTITGQIGKKAPENFNLETKTATIGIRGTIVGGIVTSGSIFCLSGTITVAPLGMPNVINVVPTGQVIHVRTPDAPPAPPAPFTPAELQQLNQNSGGALPPQGNNGQQDGGSNTPPPPPPPNGAEQATQTKQQNTIVDNIDTQVVIIQNSFYPVFNPTLQAASTNVETVELSGYATSQFKQGGTTYVSTRDTFSLYLNTSDDSIDDSTIDLYRVTHEDTFSLSKTADASTMTYKNLNEFSIKDFENHSSWMQTEKTYENDYVSWGYWAMKVNDDTKLLPTKNYWVAGVNAGDAITHIAGLPANTHYVYTGKVLGSVAEGGVFYTIASDTSSVQLKFNLGGGANSLYNDPSYSWIRFSANGKDWNLAPTLNSPTVTYGEFSDSLTGTVTQGQSSTAITSGAIQGKFYGTNAEAVGGTFNATTGTSTAFGVYKATK